MDLIRFGLAAALVLTVPGAVLATSSGAARRLPAAEKVAWCVGAGIPLWALTFLWSSLVDFIWTRSACIVLLAAGLVWLAWTTAQRTGGESRPWLAGRRRSLTLVPALAIVLVAGLLRSRDTQGLVASPWVDGYHHTVITQLFMDQGGLPQDYRPYVAADRFDYHFGFHAVCAAIAWVSGVEPRRVVLWTGQLLIALAPLSVLLWARLLGLEVFGAWVAAVLPAAWLWFPAYYLSWGRYTQLAGLVALPAVLWSLSRAFMGRGGSRPVAVLRLLPASALAAGLLLTHYRVAVFFAVGALLLAAATRLKLRSFRRLFVVGLLALFIALPWLGQGLGTSLAGFAHRASTPVVAAGAGAGAVDAAQELPTWILTQHGGGFWLRLGALGLLWAALTGRKAARALLAWTALALLLTRPEVWGASRAWAMPPFAVAISLWLVVSLGTGLLVDEVMRLPWRDRSTRRWAGPLLAAYVAVAWLGRSAAWNGQPEAAAALIAVALGLRLLGGRRTGGWRTDRHQSGGWLRPVWPSLPPDASPVTGSPWREGMPRRVAWAVIPILTLLGVGAWNMPAVLNDGTVILRAPELAAADWIRANTPGDARFFINQTLWNQGAYRGVDGGYWLPLTAGRQVSLPPAVYALHDAVTVRAVQARALRLNDKEQLADADLIRLLDEAGTDWAYVGPGSSAQSRGMVSAARLDRLVGWTRRYRRDGVSIYQRVEIAAEPSDSDPTSPGP